MKTLIILCMLFLPGLANAEPRKVMLSNWQGCESLEVLAAQLQAFVDADGNAPMVEGCNKYSAFTPFGVPATMTELAPMTIGDKTWMVVQIDIQATPIATMYTWKKLESPASLDTDA